MKISQIFKKAAYLIETRGWWNGNEKRKPEDPNSKLCLLEGLQVANGGTYPNEAVSRLQEYIGGGLISTYNDTIIRDSEHAQFVLRSAAAAVEFEDEEADTQ